MREDAGERIFLVSQDITESGKEKASLSSSQAYIVQSISRSERRFPLEICCMQRRTRGVSAPPMMFSPSPTGFFVNSIRHSRSGMIAQVFKSVCVTSRDPRLAAGMLAVKSVIEIIS